MRVGAAATLVAAVLVVLLPNPALPVLVVGLAAIALQRLRPRLDARVLSLLFVVTVTLGTLARLWHGPARLLDSSGVWAAAGVGAAASVAVNNLPATVLLTGQAPAHPFALLLGPRPRPQPRGDRLALSRALAAGCALRRSASLDRDVHRFGVVLVPVTLAVTVAVSSWT